jgi:hypothetical protein
MVMVVATWVPLLGLCRPGNYFYICWRACLSLGTPPRLFLFAVLSLSLSCSTQHAMLTWIARFSHYACRYWLFSAFLCSTKAWFLSSVPITIPASSSDVDCVTRPCSMERDSPRLSSFQVSTPTCKACCFLWRYSAWAQ